jgi:hypothetical protein
VEALDNVVWTEDLDGGFTEKQKSIGKKENPFHVSGFVVVVLWGF